MQPPSSHLFSARAEIESQRVWSAGLRARIPERSEASGRALIRRFLLRDRFEARKLSVLMTRGPDQTRCLQCSQPPSQFKNLFRNFRVACLRGHVELDWFQALGIKGCTLNGDVDVDIHSGLRPEVAGDV
jgi:hypothetical protein